MGASDYAQPLIPCTGIWLQPTTKSYREISEEIQRQMELLGIPVTIYSDNYDELLSDDVYEFITKFDNAYLIASNFKYTTHLEKALRSKSKDLTFLGPAACTSPASSNSDLVELSDLSDPCDTSNEDQFYYPALGLIIATREDVQNSSFGLMQQNIISTVDSFKTILPEMKLILVLNGIRDYAMHASEKGQENLHFNVGQLDELACRLLIEYRMDTMEVEDNVDMAKSIVKICQSIQACSHRTSPEEFREKPQAYNDIMSSRQTKLWITQLLQIPDVGKDVAKAIALLYPTPGAVIKAVEKSPEGFIDSIKNITISSRKVSISVARRIAKLYSAHVKPGEKVYEGAR
ncbi:EME1-EME2 [Babesia duncani]|uniref:EME1-EME2 n=1 Tax=Babesia duncani TaxID=323732 RepID=A0AAD9PLH6_9APIC|nr:EME1-EME2 [Babesia duncani]